MPVATTIYPKAANASVTGPALARQLDTNLIAAGWERVFVNTNAIGTGSAGAPKFDSVVYAANASMGIVVYRMPLSTLTNRWIVQVDYRWGASTNNVNPLVTTATASDAAGVLTGASAARGTGGTSFTTTSADHVITANEHEFLFAIGSSRLLVARRRSMGNVVEDDLIVAATNSGTLTGWTITSGHRCIRRNWVGGELSERGLAYMHENVSGTFTVPSTTSTADSNVGYPIGPYPMSGGLSGIPRLWTEMASTDGAGGSEQTFIVDGANVMYYCMDGTATLNSGGGSRTLIPKA